MKKRNLFVMFLLIGGLQGLYLLYWVGSVQNNFKYKLRKANLDGVATVLFFILTLGIYYFIWQWKACKTLKDLGAVDNSVITLILSILFVGISLNPFIIQSRINSIEFVNFRGKQVFS